MRRTRIMGRAGSTDRARCAGRAWGGMVLAGLLALGACGGTTVVEAGAPVPVSDSTPGRPGSDTSGETSAGAPGSGAGVTGGDPAAPGSGGGADGDPGGGVAAGAPDPADPDAPVSSGPGAGSADDLPEPEVVEPRPGMANVHPVGWERAQVLGPKKVRIHFWGGVEPCHVLDSVKVAYRAKTVVVTLYSGSDPAKPDVACIEIEMALAVEVTLTKALGGRRLVDGHGSAQPAPPAGEARAQAPAG